MSSTLRAARVSEQFLNGTSAQSGYTVPFMLVVVKKLYELDHELNQLINSVVECSVLASR